VLGVAALAGVLAAALPKMMDLYAGKIGEFTEARSTEVRLIQEGRVATVTVLDQVDPKRGTYRDMYLNGVEEASTRYWHTQLFKLLGSFPVLIHEGEEPKKVLVIAFGAGITAGSVLASDRVSYLDVVDLNPDVEGINDLFADVNGDVFHRPRFHFHHDDGRNYLVTGSKRYDVIISDSTHPRAYDSWVLYTEEFYRAVAARLLPGGIFAQWVPVLGNMQGDLFRIHLNTFRSVFPNSTFWYVYGSDQAFLLATPEPFTLDVEYLQEQLDRLPEWFRAGEYQIDTVERIAGFFWLDGEAMVRMIGDETRVNTDDLHYFDKQSALEPAPPQLRLPRFQVSALPYFMRAEDTLRDAIRTEQMVAQLLARVRFLPDAAGPVQGVLPDARERQCAIFPVPGIPGWQAAGSRDFLYREEPEPAGAASPRSGQVCRGRAPLQASTGNAGEGLRARARRCGGNLEQPGYGLPGPGQVCGC
jgi:spermidine synthase